MALALSFLPFTRRLTMRGTSPALRFRAIASTNFAERRSLYVFPAIV
jgi:hypothetical protein